MVSFPCSASYVDQRTELGSGQLDSLADGLQARKQTGRLGSH